jgi:hypothetical protein
VNPTIALSPETRTTAGILLLTIVFVEYGGLYVLGIVRGRQKMTPFQLTFARAGHAHAGVLVILSLACAILADAVGLSGVQALLARTAIPLAAILMPAGYFLSSAGAGRTEPNRLIYLLYAGAVSLALGVVSLGLALLTAG